MRTEKQHRNIVALSVIRREKQIAYSPFGPVKAGLTTSPRTKEDQVLTELLNYLEKLIADLNTKSFTASDTLERDTKAMRAEPTASTLDTDGTDE